MSPPLPPISAPPFPLIIISYLEFIGTNTPPSGIRRRATSTSVRVSTTAPTPTAHANDARHFFAPPPFNSFHRKRSPPPPPKNCQTASSRPAAHSVVRYFPSPQWLTPCYRRQHRSSHVPAAQTLITLCRHCPSFIRKPTLAHLRPCLWPPTNPRLHPWAYSLGGPAHMPRHPPAITCVCASDARRLMVYSWRIGMYISIRWWLHRCLEYHARKALYQTPSYSTLYLSSPNAFGISVVCRR